MTFGERLQELRRKAGMSQDTLAEKLEVSRQAVSKWERDDAMPETEKVIRIARLFDVSLDTLLMGKEPAPEPEPQPRYQPPQYRATGISGHRVEQFVRRHGYKAGYAMMIWGGVLCAFSLIMYLVWPAIGNAFFGGFTSAFTDPYGFGEIRIEGDIPAGMEDIILDELYGSSYGGFWNDGVSRMSSAMNSALRAQAAIFLIPMLPGVALLVGGWIVVKKGKEIAAKAAG